MTLTLHCATALRPRLILAAMTVDATDPATQFPFLLRFTIPTRERLHLVFYDLRVNRSSDGPADVLDALLKVLFKLEAEAKALSPPERQAWRDQHVAAVLKEIKDWLDAKSLAVLPKSPMGIAIGYARRHWVAFTNFMRDGRIRDITNNAAERALRAVAVARKNWMFIGHEDAGEPAVVLMSLIQTCRECGVDPAAYLRDVLVQISEAGTAKNIAQLTPKGWKLAADAAERDRLARQAVLNVVRELVVP
jgi:transposase